MHRLDHPAVKALVAGLHVRKRGRVEHIGHQRQEPIADPVQQQHVLALSGETTSVDHECLVLHDRVEQFDPVLRVIFEVCVLDDDQVAGGRLEARSQRSPLALVLSMVEHSDGGVLKSGQHLVGAVGGSVVDHHDLNLEGHIDRADPPDHFANGRPLVVDGHEHAEGLVVLLLKRSLWRHDASRSR